MPLRMAIPCSVVVSSNRTLASRFLCEKGIVFLTTTGGHFLTSGHALECDGPYGFVRAIREQMKNGVDHIKLNLSGGIMGPDWDRHWHSFLMREEIEAAFEICHRREFKVMAHATNPQAVKDAVRLGA